MAEVTIGGERLGSGKKMKAYMHNYERSTHDLSYIWRSSMSAGTLVPFMSRVGLPGDTFDIELNCEVMTHPTEGPLFGSYKVQLDVFKVPVRLYQGMLHMNMLNIGRDMSKVKLPQVLLAGKQIDPTKPIDNQQVNPSSIFAYLGIRGVGHNPTAATGTLLPRWFNAIPYLAYWDIYKNYYANKQEEIGMVIHKKLKEEPLGFTSCTIYNNNTPSQQTSIAVSGTPSYVNTNMNFESYMVIEVVSGFDQDVDPRTDIEVLTRDAISGQTATYKLGNLFINVSWSVDRKQIVCANPDIIVGERMQFGRITSTQNFNPLREVAPGITQFPLENIDNMRKDILQWTSPDAFEITYISQAPYGLPLENEVILGEPQTSMAYTQEGLALKTYQSDLFNNWISTEWIDGPDGISAITAIDTSGGSFTIDELNLSNKIYNMLNRIALSGGSYDDWLDAVYTHDRYRQDENPVYCGGLIKELIFEEVVSLAGAGDAVNPKPLGTLAGRGRLSKGKHKGGNIVIKVDEPCYIMGIISLTPRIDYSQGNQWDVNLKTMNDFHKPALDEIGFQDLITDQMHWAETELDGSGNPTFKSAGKQPAWINYMTDVNRVYGNFAIENNEMFMTLNRRYELDIDAENKVKIKDLTTYIDPSKYNNIFAVSKLDAQNFWAQIAVDMKARRKMSAKIIPNL